MTRLCEFYVLALLAITVESRTIRSKIITNSNGTKELILDPNSAIPQHEIDFLTKDLNNLNVTTENAKSRKMIVVTEDKDNVGSVENSTKKPEELNENILMKHWNTLTEVGWNNANFRRPVKRMYVNNTRVLKFVPVANVTEKYAVKNGTTNSTESEPPHGRKIWDARNDSKGPEVKAEPPKSRKIWDIFNHLYHCVESFTVQSGMLKCLAMRISSVFYPYMGKSTEEENVLEDYVEMLDFSGFFENRCSNATGFENATGTDANATAEGREMTPKSYIYGHKKLLHAILLPLLVVIVIKYLLALPLIVLGVLTTKTFWLSLMSAGVATFGDLMKKRSYVVYRPPTKKFGQGQGPSIEVNSVPSASNLYWSQLPVPWSAPKPDDRLVRMIPIDDKFYM